MEPVGAEEVVEVRGKDRTKKSERGRRRMKAGREAFKGDRLKQVPVGQLGPHPSLTGAGDPRAVHCGYQGCMSMRSYWQVVCL